jgi:ectoine hydroxylase-related dioxygenase (phytanoyl-CoA dioxygenase family)
MMHSAMDRFNAQGFESLPEMLGEDERRRLEHCLDRQGDAIAARNLLERDWCRRLAGRVRADDRLARLIPAADVAVQCTYFEKSLASNWLVPIHQDLSIAVDDRIEASGLQGWSMKDGTWFVQPPVAVLERLLAVRLHFDPCGVADGPLRIVPGSHDKGRIDSHTAVRLRNEAEVVCEAGAGDALVMRPLILHASSKATSSSRRRVLHFVFGPPALPSGLRWRHAVR